VATQREVTTTPPPSSSPNLAPLVHVVQMQQLMQRAKNEVFLKLHCKVGTGIHSLQPDMHYTYITLILILMLLGEFKYQGPATHRREEFKALVVLRLSI
jgi:hypothetical protein